MKKLLCAILIFFLIPFGSASAQAPFTYRLCAFERTAGSFGEAKAADLIFKEFKSIGYTPTRQKFQTWYQKKFISSSNLIADKKSQNPDAKLLIIGGHYDSFPGSKGAIDNGASIEAIIRLAEAVKEQEYEFDIRFVAFGSEEIGYLGSKHYVNTMSDYDISRLIGYINLDMVGYDFLEIATMTGSGNFLTDYIQPIGDFAKVQEQKKSDHAIFENFLGVPSMTFYSENPYYHTKEDTADKVNFESLDRCVSILLETLRQMEQQTPAA